MAHGEESTLQGNGLGPGAVRVDEGRADEETHSGGQKTRRQKGEATTKERL